MIRTFKIKHYNNYSKELAEAQVVTSLVVSERTRQKANKEKLKMPSTANHLFANIDLKTTIICQLIKKYFNNKKLKAIKKHPKLMFNHNGGKQLYMKGNILHLTPLKMKIDLSNEWFYKQHTNLKPLNVEVDNTYIYLTCEIPDTTQIQPNSFLGIDLNATGDLAVICDANTGKVFKMGKEMRHIKQRFQALRSKRQSGSKKKCATKDSNRTMDMCRKIAVEIVSLAENLGKGINLEDLKLKKRKGYGKKTLNKLLQTFPFGLLKQCILNRAERFGVKVQEVDPRYTSQSCSHCGCIGTKQKQNRYSTKEYRCVNCGHTDHADANAGFNISLLNPWSCVNAWSMI
jgi:putative transposase